MAGATAFPASAIISGIISIDRLPPGLTPFVVATGAGTSDATAALQAAIESAYGKLLYIPTGEYTISQNASTGYCLRIMDSVSILMEPGAVLRLATSVPNTVNAIQIGDGTTAVSGVTIEGGIIDGDAVANGGAYSVAKAAIYVSGPVQRVSLRGLSIRNCLAAGLVVSGESSESRAKYITVEDCTITEVAEGVRFEKCDEFHMRGGSITQMMAQDCFEPHGAVRGWSLRDCYVDTPHITNSAIEIFPQHGDIENGLIDNCTIVDEEIRISIQSGSGGNTVRGVLIQNCYLKNSNIYAGVNGNFRGVSIENCKLEGPCNVPRNTSKPFCGILSTGTGNTINIVGNRIWGYQSHGINVASSDALITGNEIYNNGQDATLSVTQRFGILTFGNRARITDNLVYDDQATPTQQAGVSYAGNDNSIIGNKFWGNVSARNLSGKSPLRAMVFGNLGIADVVKTTVVMTAGTTSKIIDHSAIGISSLNYTSAVAQPITNMSPATRTWFTRSGGLMRLHVDVAPASDTDFLLIVYVSPEFTVHP